MKAYHIQRPFPQTLLDAITNKDEFYKMRDINRLVGNRGEKVVRKNGSCWFFAKVAVFSILTLYFMSNWQFIS